MIERRADDLRTKSEAARAFVHQGSGRVLLAAAIGLALARIGVGRFRPADVVLVVVVVALIGPFEWLLHRLLLHAPAGSVRMRRLHTGTGHVEHHKDPGELTWLMLGWREASAFTLVLGVLSAIFALVAAALLDASAPALFVTAWTVAAASLLHYEWTHLLVHTRYRCRSRHYHRLQQHHRLHHYRNEHYWLGVTVRTGDRLFHTMPERGAVEASPTARSLSASARS